jgi:L-ascorbate metabolism protein UlaG (beta-lactamase superfamily)
MIIRWHGHACFEVSNNHVIVTDPHDGKSIGIKPPQVKGDLVLVSHGHFDHNSVKSVLKSSTKTIDSPGKHREFDIEVKGIQVFHDSSNGERRGKNCIFKFNVDGPMDILFVPIGNVFTIGAQDAWKTIKMLKPKVAIPMHYRVGGLSLSIQPIDPFLSNADKIERVGNEIDFETEDLPQDFEVWVFSL